MCLCFLSLCSICLLTFNNSHKEKKWKENSNKSFSLYAKSDVLCARATFTNFCDKQNIKRMQQTIGKVSTYASIKTYLFENFIHVSRFSSTRSLSLTVCALYFDCCVENPMSFNTPKPQKSPHWAFVTFYCVNIVVNKHKIHSTKWRRSKAIW